MHPRSFAPGILGSLASAAGVTFAALSTHDYASHLDRQLHGTHCSFIPGLAEASADNACTKAMYSPYSAVLKQVFWGGIPISLFGLGAFLFFFAFSLYLLLARETASKRFRLGYLLCTVGPVLASALMLVISLTKLGDVCKLCVGIYVSSFALLGAGILGMIGAQKSFGVVGAIPGQPPPSPPRTVDADATQADPQPWHQATKADPRNVLRGVDEKSRAVEPPRGSVLSLLGLPLLLGLSCALPGGVYAASLPDYKPIIKNCGSLTTLTEKHDALVKIPTKKAVQPALFFEDPLCPTCKAFHERLVDDGVYEQLDVTVAIFPLDSECNWLLSRPMHPGACVLARAFLCGDKAGNAREILEWSYENQEELTALGKSGVDKVRAKVVGRFASVETCIDSADTKKRLDHVLHFAVANKLRISTPQLFLGDQRMCDEDTDLGLTYALTLLAPKVKP